MRRRKLAVLILIGVILCLLTAEAECGVVLKALVVNPSRTKTQEAVLKAYLPKESKQEDIIELGDLKIDYDIEKGLYYVYKKFELKPGESASRSIEIKDIWIIPESKIEALSVRGEKLVEKLKDTEYFDLALTMQKDIEEKRDGILDKQEKAKNALCQIHIAVYRENMDTMDTANSALARLEKMIIETRVARAQAASGSEGAGAKVSIKATWRLIMGMIIALGVLSFTFFIIWHRQAIKLKEEEKKEEPPYMSEKENK